MSAALVVRRSAVSSARDRFRRYLRRLRQHELYAVERAV